MSKLYISGGHGGKDSGAVAQGYKEKDYTIMLSNKVIALLNAVGHQTVTDRTTDKDSKLNDKTKQANSAKVDAVFEIHLNAGGGTGCEGYHSRVGGKGKTLAVNICNEISKLGYRNRGAKTKRNILGKDYFAIIRNTTAPAVLVECCFLDSVADMKNFNADKMAQAIVNGILSVYPAPKPIKPPAPKPIKKSNETIAKEVIAGKWGNGTDRKNRLTSAGYNYSVIQKIG